MQALQKDLEVLAPWFNKECVAVSVQNDGGQACRLQEI
jgi:hypothetical protein